MDRRTTLAGLGAALLVPLAARAQPAWPSRPIRIIVGFSPGGAVDEMARTLADRLAPRLGQALVVENKPGAASTLAADFVANAPADGHVLLLSGTSTLIARHMQGRASADVTRFTPVAGIAGSPMAIVAHPAFPARDPEGFVREIKARPGKYFYATSGVGTLHNLSMEMLKKQLGLDVDHVPYKGASAIMPDLLSGQMPLAVISASAAEEHAKAGKLRVIALLHSGGWAGEPSWRSVSEVAPGFNVMSRLFLLGPAGLPPAIVARLDGELAQALKTPEVLRSFASQGAVPQHASAAALAAELARENENWSQVVKSLGLKTG
ncbi:tripartite tricarboxylate transporter substrate binding protein [Ramlibacter tataouinensis]|uniref:Bug family tripartite tricarboxylate transporter substrate binding protein n=1 Tax=Ramlibacter tataouinensis TaxID=94132 RepID=UPI0022F3ECB4|nr:tripartite tricarboxylate transporter substrate binding protein [Ramlibacter tataouinensis]WBY02848.1 tripartite tricarboxylate transporter substrate binding protein [Ramlibacter tataouinensis]